MLFDRDIKTIGKHIANAMREELYGTPTVAKFATVQLEGCLASDGHEVKVLHAVHYKDPIYREVFGELIGTRYYRKCPDLLVDGDFVEYESYRSYQPKNAFRNMLHNGLAQSDSVILRHCNLTDGYMMRKILSKKEKGVDITMVWIFDGQGLRTLYKTEG